MPQIGKLTVITAFDADNSEYPILGILCDPRAPGYQIPEDLAPHPDGVTWPDHVFHSAVFGQNDGRVQWLYSIFPGPWTTITRQGYDGQTETIKSRRNIAANVTTEEALSGGIWTRNYRQAQNDDLICTEINEARAVPGDYVPFTRYDLQLGPIAGTRRLVANSGLSTTLTAVYKRTYDAHENSDLVVWELVETNSDSSGSPGNPAYPIRVTDFYDNDRGAVERTSQIVTDITTAGSLTVTGTTPTAVATLTRYEPINQFLRDKIVETWTLNGPTLRAGERYDDALGLVTSTRQLVDGTSNPAQSESASGLTKYEASSYGNPVVWKIVESWNTAAFPTRTQDGIDEPRGAFQTTVQLEVSSSVVGSLVVSGGNLATLTEYEPRNEYLLEKKITTWAVPGPVLRASDRYDESLGNIVGTRKLVENSSQASSESASGRTRYESSNYGAALIWEVVESWNTGAFPTITENIFDQERGAVERNIILVTDLTTNGSLAESGGTVTEITFQPRNAFLRRRITETWTVPAELFTQDIYDPEKGPVQRTTQLIAMAAVTGTIAIGSGVVTETSYQPVNEVVLRKIIETWGIEAPAVVAPALIRYDTDDEAQVGVTITTQLISKPANYAALGNTAGTQVDYVPINDYYGRKITLTIGATPTGHTEYHTKGFTFPALVSSISVSGGAAKDGTVYLFSDWTHRAERTVPTTIKAEISYGTSLTPEAAEWPPGTQDLMYSGPFIRPPSMRGVLNNNITTTFNTASDNPKWGYVAETLNIAASSPTVTTYLASWVGAYKVLSSDVVNWKYNLQRKTTLSVLVK